MVKLKFIVLDGVLALRISENKTRYYKRVTHLLKGSLLSPPLHQDSGTQIYTKKPITIGELSGQYYFGQKGQSYCSRPLKDVLLLNSQ